MSTASEFETTLSPAASIFSWSRVTGGFGSFSSTAAWIRISPKGTCRLGRCAPCACFSRDQNSFQVTTSGPPSSNVRFAASGFSIAAAKYAATSSTQIGWIRCVPGPTIGVTGASFAIFLNWPSAPPSARR